MAAALTSTLLKHHVAPRLESILDKESKITHEMLSAQIETRLGSGEAKDSKGPDMKVWNKGKGLENVGRMTSIYSLCFSSSSRQIGLLWSSATRRSLFQNHRNRDMIFGILWNRQKITLRTRVCFWWPSECATSPIARMLAALSLWILMLYATLYLSVTFPSLVLFSGSRSTIQVTAFTSDGAAFIYQEWGGHARCLSTRNQFCKAEDARS